MTWMTHARVTRTALNAPVIDRRSRSLRTYMTIVDRANGGDVPHMG